MKTATIIFFVFVATVFSFAISRQTTFAFVPSQQPPGGAITQVFPHGLPDVLAKACEIFYWLFTAAIIISIIMLIWGAINYMIGGANQEMIKKATNMFTYAVVGIIVAILAKAIPYIIASFLGTTLTGGC